MKKHWNEYFCIPKNGKIHDKAMRVRVALTVFVMVACLAAMSISAYACFSYNVSSGSNLIKAASFQTVLTITDETGAPMEVSSDEQSTHTAKLPAGVYNFTLALGAQNTAKTGFGIVTVEGKDSYHTQQLGHDNGILTPQISFQLTIDVEAGKAQTVTVASHWGTSSRYNYTNTDLYIVDTTELTLVIGEGGGLAEKTASEEETEIEPQDPLEEEEQYDEVTDEAQDPLDEEDTAVPEDPLYAND